MKVWTISRYDEYLDRWEIKAVFADKNKALENKNEYGGIMQEFEVIE